jgi:hypothetical protein
MALSPEVEENYQVDQPTVVTTTIPRRISIGSWLHIDIAAGGSYAGGTIKQHYALSSGPPRHLTSDELQSAADAFTMAAEAAREYDDAVAEGREIR